MVSIGNSSEIIVTIISLLLHLKWKFQSVFMPHEFLPIFNATLTCMLIHAIVSAFSVANLFMNKICTVCLGCCVSCVAPKYHIKFALSADAKEGNGKFMVHTLYMI